MCDQQSTITITQPLTHRQDYECAAWYSWHQSDTGTYPLALHISKSPDLPIYVVSIPCTIINSDFTSYFGGVAIGSGRDNNRNGERSEIQFKFPFVASINDKRFSIAKNDLKQVEQLLEDRISELIAKLNKLTPQNDHSVYHNTITLISAYGSWIAANADALKKVKKTLRERYTVDEHVVSIINANRSQGYESSLIETSRRYAINIDLSNSVLDEIIDKLTKYEGEQA